MTPASVRALMGLCGTNNYQVCSQQGTSNHSSPFHTCWTPANTFVLNTLRTEQGTEQRFNKKPCLLCCITIETRPCFHIPAHRREFDFETGLATSPYHRLERHLMSDWCFYLSFPKRNWTKEWDLIVSIGRINRYGTSTVSCWGLCVCQMSICATSL